MRHNCPANLQQYKEVIGDLSAVLEAVVLDCITLCNFGFEQLKTTFEIIFQGMFVVIATGVYPDSSGVRFEPGRLDSDSQQDATQAHANEFGKESKIHDFNIAILLGFQFEVAGAFTFPVSNPCV